MGVNLIVVLGKVILPDGTLSEESKRNVEKAAELFKAGAADRIAMSGRWPFSVKAEPPRTEAEAMKEYAISLGVPKGAILVEDRSLDTTGNAYYLGKMIVDDTSIKKLIVVTVDYHMPRAEYIFKAAFSERFKLKFAKSDSGITGELLKQKQKSEAKTTDLMRKLYTKADCNGFEGFCRTVERTHPLYATDYSTVPQIVWDAFSSAGFSKEYLIGKYGKGRSKVF
ncbi:MAG: YdcF family protein [Candidatus Micrarchaeota archaeon]|nr:YdcF family protein [Candidatus Micrarchaeota archaeon]